MAEEIRMYARSDFGEDAAPAEGNPAQEIELEDEEEESIASVLDADVVEVLIVGEAPIAETKPAKKAAKRAPARKATKKRAPAKKAAKRTTVRKATKKRAPARKAAKRR